MENLLIVPVDSDRLVTLFCPHCLTQRHVLQELNHEGYCITCTVRPGHDLYGEEVAALAKLLGLYHVPIRFAESPMYVSVQ
jgi:hypothetical protein